MNASRLNIRLCAAALLLASAPALAERPIDERRPATADIRVTVTNVAGQIQVQAWDRNEVHITGYLGEDVEKLEISGSASDLRIEVRLPPKERITEDTELQLRVPVGASIVADGVSADVTVQGTRGSVKASSVSGDVQLSTDSKVVEARTVSGDISLNVPAAKTVFNSVSGEVTARGASGELRGETVSGGVFISGGGMGAVTIKTVSGDVTLDIALTDSANVEVDTLSGQLELRVPGNTSATVAMDTFSGELDSTFGEGVRGRKSLDHKLGAGKARVQLHSFSGDIRLEKR